MRTHVEPCSGRIDNADQRIQEDCELFAARAVDVVFDALAESQSGIEAKAAVGRPVAEMVREFDALADWQVALFALGVGIMLGGLFVLASASPARRALLSESRIASRRARSPSCGRA